MIYMFLGFIIAILIVYICSLLPTGRSHGSDKAHEDLDKRLYESLLKKDMFNKTFGTYDTVNSQIKKKD